MLKSKMKKIIAIALTATMMISASSMPAMVNAAEIESSSAVSEEAGIYKDFRYSISDGEATITRYIGGNTQVEIPSEINGAPVTIIGYRAFADTGVIKVVVPDSVKIIYKRAFNLCTKLTDISLSKNLERIEYFAFCDCTSLTNITFHESLVYIDDYGFYNTGLKEIVLPNSVTSLGYNVFGKCQNLTDITLSDNMEEIGISSFSGLKNLKNIKLPANLKTIGMDAFSGCEGLTEIVIPKSVTTIEYVAFNNCDGLTEIVIPDSVRTIVEKAFINCDNLKKITIPEAVTEIGEYAFGYTCEEVEPEPGFDYSKYEYNKIEGVIIYGYKDSVAQNYAEKYNVKFYYPFIGDINLDDFITISDATLMQRYCAEDAIFDERQLNNADVDGNGNIDINDATAIQKIVAAN